MLGRCLGLRPERITFSYGCAGKPMLPPPAELRFNVAHSNSPHLVQFLRESLRAA